MTNDAFLADILPKLSAAMPYKWRVQSFSKHKPEATCVAYIDARDAMQRLDEVCSFGWHRDHKELKGHLFSGVGIVMPDGTTVWRYDCGVESNTEAEKGEASDSFKRAAVNWGVGRFLYDLEIKKLPANEKKEQNNYPYVVDQSGGRVWDLTKHIGVATPDSSEKQKVVNYFLELNKCIREHMQSIVAVKMGIKMNEYSRAAEAWYELSEDVQKRLWVAESKGGCFTTEERRVMQLKEFRESYYGEQQ